MTLSEKAFAEQILFGTTLDDKLVEAGQVRLRDDGAILAAIGAVAFPGRPAGLRPGDRGAAAFPKREVMDDPRARGQVLHFFANHELLALELMALALLRFPDAPVPFRQGLIRTMQEEQAHMRLYLQRMASLGVAFGDLPVSDFFWNALKDMSSPREYVVGMSLTFEQANLDFSLQYRDLFHALGDETTAQILEKVYRDEIGHVKHGLVWFERWRSPLQSLWQSYVESLQLPLSSSRAKGKVFDQGGRRAAGFDEDFIRRLELCGGSKGRSPTVLWFNPDVEMEVAQALVRPTTESLRADAYAPMARHAAMMAELDSVLSFLAKDGDVVLCRQEPSLDHLAMLKKLGVVLPEFRQGADPLASLRAMMDERVLGRLEPWGWGPRALRVSAQWQGKPFDEQAVRQSLWQLYAKTELPGLRTQARVAEPLLLKGLGPELMDGRVVEDEAALISLAREIHLALGSAVLIKAPFSAAGRERIRIDAIDAITAPQRAWLAKAWQQWGQVLVEPFVNIVADGSLLGDLVEGRENKVQLEPSLFFCDRRGQYRGHHIIPQGFAGFPAHLRTFLLERVQGHSLADALQASGRRIASHLAGLGYRGRFGVDFHIYHLPGDSERLYLQAVSEINARTTMGHVALALGRLLATGARGLWVSMRRQELSASGYKTLSEMACRLQDTFPCRFSERQDHALKEGIFFTHDPTQSHHALGVVAVGEAAMLHVRRMAALTASP